MSAFPFAERPYYLKCHDCGLKVPLTNEQRNTLEFPAYGLDVCPNCGEKAYGLYTRDPMSQMVESAGKGLLNTAARWFRNRR